MERMIATMTPEEIETALSVIAKADPTIAKAMKQVGCPEPRNRPTGFGTLVDIIVDQQGQVAQHTDTQQAYSRHTLVGLLHAAGFGRISVKPALSDTN